MSLQTTNAEPTALAPAPIPADGTIEPVVTLSPEVIAEREARDAKLKRFNLLAVYLPIALVTLLVIVLMIGLIVATLVSDGAADRAMGSGFADLVLTSVVLIPMSLLCAVFPAAGGFLLYKRREKGSIVRKPLTNVLRKVDGGIVSAESKYKQIEPKIVEPTIKFRSGFAYAETIFLRLKAYILEKINRN